MSVSPESLVSGSPDAWHPIVAGNAELKLTPISERSLRMDFDFKGAGGFVVARRPWNRTMPEEFALNFKLRGSGASNDVEVKLVDDTGLNVWRKVFKRFQLPRRWKKFTVESRDIEFAWGPSSSRSIATLGWVEFAIVAGEGGQGRLWLADVDIVDRTPQEPRALSVSSEISGFEAAKAVNGLGWKPRPDDRRPWIVIDLQEERVLGGLIIDWVDGAPVRGFRVSSSSTGRRWKTVHNARRAGGRCSYIYLPALKARFLRLAVAGPSAGAVLRPQAFDFSRTVAVFWHNIADAQPRGWHPRWVHREQCLWTPLGISRGRQCALMNEDGMVEPFQGSFSIEPMLRIEGQLITWSEVSAEQRLLHEWQPVPSVIWKTADWELRIHGEATVAGEVLVRYAFDNGSTRSLTARLFLLLRPFQVTPPWQSFRTLGGVSPIRRLEWRDGAVMVDNSLSVSPLTRAEGFGALDFDQGLIGEYLAEGRVPPDAGTSDSSGFASGVLEFDVSTAQGQRREHVVLCRTAVPSTPSSSEAAFDWDAVMASNQWQGNGWCMEAVRAALTATAHVLVTRSGPALQPGPRRYTRSWIRDGAMMSAALLRMRHVEEVSEFITWYAPHQRDDGFVPCCVDSEGVDWLVEHDSHGQLIALIADHHRFGADAALLEHRWTFVERAVGCIARLLEATTGLLPVSVSHEGYLAQPVHSFWDDFWALRGLRDAVYLAKMSARGEQARQWQELERRFAQSLFAAVEAIRARRALDFIPGSIEWADFDPTATANAIYLLGVPRELDRQALERTFDKYLEDWRAKRAGTLPAVNYTPYEIRIIGALVRLGRREDALELLRFFLSDRRPLRWNQWPEISWRDLRAPAHIGDLPHTWIAAEYVLAVRSLFAYERESDECLVIAAGLASEWLDDAGVRVTVMPTLYGALSYELRRLKPGTLCLKVQTALQAKLLLEPPLRANLREVTVNGEPHDGFESRSVTILNTPAEVIFTCHEE